MSITLTLLLQESKAFHSSKLQKGICITTEQVTVVLFICFVFQNSDIYIWLPLYPTPLLSKKNKDPNMP